MRRPPSAQQASATGGGGARKAQEVCKEKGLLKARGRARTDSTQPYRAVQQHTPTAGLTAGAQYASILQEGGESPWGDPLLHLSLQSHRISITCITLPGREGRALRF